MHSRKCSLFLFSFLFLRLEEFESVDTDEDVAETVDLEQVSELGVEPQAADGEGRVIFEVPEMVGVPDLDQTLDQELESEDLKMKEK